MATDTTISSADNPNSNAQQIHHFGETSNSIKTYVTWTQVWGAGHQCLFRTLNLGHRDNVQKSSHGCKYLSFCTCELQFQINCSRIFLYLKLRFEHHIQARIETQNNHLKTSKNENGMDHILLTLFITTNSELGYVSNTNPVS